MILIYLYMYVDNSYEWYDAKLPIEHKVTFIVPQTIERLSWFTPRITWVIEKGGVHSDFYSTSRLCKDQSNRSVINVRTIPRLGDGNYM